MIFRDIGITPYREAWDIQLHAHERVLAGAEEEVLFVQHPPVITFGRRAEDSAKHLVASRDLLSNMGVEVVESDRGGDITFHGPGQLVCYPIIHLARHRLSVGGYVKMLEHMVIRALKSFNISTHLEPEAIGVWTDTTPPKKICALGVRIKRGVSLHGIALNVTTDLRYFNLIVPCGLNGRPVTSISEILGEQTPPMNIVQAAIRSALVASIEENQPQINTDEHR